MNSNHIAAGQLQWTAYYSVELCSVLTDLNTHCWRNLMVVVSLLWFSGRGCILVTCAEEEAASWGGGGYHLSPWCSHQLTMGIRVVRFVQLFWKRTVSHPLPYLMYCWTLITMGLSKLIFSQKMGPCPDSWWKVTWKVIKSKCKNNKWGPKRC